MYYIENIIDDGDKYYGKIISFSHVFNIGYILMYIIFGISILNHQGLSDINVGIRLFVCIILLIKFHPFREHRLNESDSTLIFSSALFLFFNLSIFEILTRLTKTIGIDI
jgi:hypothetical protein